MWLDKNEEEFEWVKIEREIFKIVRDKNGDGKMDFEEVKNWIMFFDYDYFEVEIRYFIYELDFDKVCIYFGFGWGIFFGRCFKIIVYFFFYDFVLYVLLVKFNLNI